MSTHPTPDDNDPIRHLARINAHPRDQRIQFFEEGHIYEIDGVPGTYTSVTTWNHSLFSSFDKDRAIAMILKNKRWNTDPEYPYYQMPAEAILKKWEDKAATASAAGTQMHLNIEQHYNGVPVHNTSVEFQYFQNFLADFPHLEAYRTEWCVFHEELRICGSIDMVYRNKLTGKFCIYDWKRAQEISYVAFGNKTSHVPCLADIPDTNFWHYSLQLNTYRYILETKYDMTFDDDMYLVVLHPDTPEKNYLRVRVQDMRDRMEDIWKYRREVLARIDAGLPADDHHHPIASATDDTESKLPPAKKSRGCLL